MRASFTYNYLCNRKHIGYYPRFRKAILDLEVNYSRVTHQSAAISFFPQQISLAASPSQEKSIARLACLIYAASVHSEPGSNSPKKFRKIMYNGSNDSFNFKPHELTLVIPFEITMASLGNSIIKRANKKTSRQNCRDAKYILAPLLSMLINNRNLSTAF